MGLTNIQFSGAGEGPCEFSANIRLRFEEMAAPGELGIVQRT
jgi:hypothetical protein